jgi:hypothetical protein
MGEFFASGQIKSKNGVVMTLKPDYEADERLWHYTKER